MRSFEEDTDLLIPRMIIFMVFWFYRPIVKFIKTNHFLPTVIVIPMRNSVKFKHTLSSSVVLSPRYMHKKYQDALAIMIAFRSKPDIFLTMTARVYKMQEQHDKMIKNVTKKKN